MTEPTDPNRRMPLPAPVDPYGQHAQPHEPEHVPPPYPQSQNPESPYPESPYQPVPYQQAPYGHPSYPQPAYDPGAQVPPGYPSAPYGYPAIDPATGLPLSDKSRVAAGVLSIVLGAFGAGRFYTGHVGIAIAQIAVTWLTCGLGHIWPLIDGIIVLTQGGTDSKGRALRS